MDEIFAQIRTLQLRPALISGLEGKWSKEPVFWMTLRVRDEAELLSEHMAHVRRVLDDGTEVWENVGVVYEGGASHRAIL